MADDDFKLAGAFVEVRLKDQTEADEKKIRARLEAGKPVTLEVALQDPDNTRMVKERIEREVKPTIRPEVTNPIDEAWRRKIQAAIKSTATTALDVPVTPDTAMFRRNLETTLKAAERQLHADIPVEPGNAAKFRAELETLVASAESRVKARIPVQVDEKTARDSARRAGTAVDTELSRVAARANAQFDLLTFAGLSLGLPAAALIGAAGATAAIGLVPIAVAAFAAHMISQNLVVKDSFNDMANDVIRDTSDMASVMAGPLAKASDDLHGSFEKIKPELEALFTGSIPAVHELTGAVTDFTENTMPGMVTAVARSGPVLRAVRTFAGEAGSGFSDFFMEISDGSEAAGRDMDQLGAITRDLLGFLGAFLANLATGGAGPLAQFRGMLAQVEETALTLTSSGMPLLQGTTSGFLGTVSGGLSILQGFASLLGGWAGPVGEAGGALLSTNMIARLFGTSLGQVGFGLGALTPKLDESGNRTNAFKQAMADAEKGGTSRFKAGVGALLDGGVNPLGLALMAGGILLDAWGKKAQDAATRAAEQKQAVSDLTKAYMEDNGVIGANVRATTQKALSDQNAYLNNKVFGVSLQETSAAGLGNAEALATVNTRAKEYITSLLSGNDANRQMTPQILAAADAFAKQGGNASDLVDNLSAVRMHHLSLTDAQRAELIQTLDGITATNAEARANVDAARKAEALAEAQRKIESVIARATTPAMYAAKVAAADLASAYNTLNATSGDVAAKGQALVEVMLRLAGQAPSVEEALQKWNDDLRGIKDSFEKLDIKKHAKDLVDSSGAINTVTEAGSKLKNTVQQGVTDFAAYAQSLKDAGTPADEIKTKLQGMRDAFAGQLKQLGLTPAQIDKVLTHYGMLPDKVITQLGLEGDTETQAKITDIVTQLNNIPAEKGLKVEALTAPAIKALGDLGYTVVKLPDGTFRVFANTKPGQDAAQSLLNQVGNSNATATVFANTSPADGAVTNWKNTTTQTVGNTTTYTSVDPATGMVRQWKATTDSTGAVTHTYADINPATGAVRVWKQQADGTWAETHAKADVAAAEAALNNAARDRTAVIHTTVVGTPGSALPAGPTGKSKWNAQGNILKFFAGGGFEGLTPMRTLATIVPPDTWRVVGDNPRFPESYIPLDPTSARSQALLDETNARMGRSGGTTINNNVTVHTAAQEPYLTAAAVSGELGWAMRGA